MGQDDQRAIFQNDKRLKLWTVCLNLITQACHEEFKDVLSQNKDYQGLAGACLGIWVRVLQNHESIIKDRESANRINDLLFYCMGLYSSSMYVSEASYTIYE